MPDPGPELDFPSHHKLHHLMWEAYVHMLPVCDEVFEDAELTLPMAGTLDEIGTSPGLTVADISRRTPKTQQAISQLVAKLEQRGFVERRVGSGRGVGLWLTPAGERAHADGIEREKLIEARLYAILGDDVAERLREALEIARLGFRDQSAKEGVSS